MKLAVRRLVLAAAPTLAVGLAGCSIHEQTQDWYTAANGVNAEAGDIGLRNVLVIAEDDRATVIASLANRGDADRLVDVMIGDVAAELTGELDIPAQGQAIVGPHGERVDLDDAEAVPGHMVDVEFRFGSAPRVTVQALVMSAEGAYADALPDETQTKSPEPTPTAG